MRGSRTEPITFVHDLVVQSQVLFNIKVSNKEERERIVVRRFKFEEPRLEQIQDLEAREMNKRREGKSGEARAALRRSVRDNGLSSKGDVRS
ncbi:hypothetical protein Scep_025610 [Stephania cephalantha]|uniref:Uncharacterized protein n=1 Tax=Stephania cephalantha TaxID=152367 RepID=A0AAP0HRQ9_9MAGN